jgi:hypothetical protein
MVLSKRQNLQAGTEGKQEYLKASAPVYHQNCLATLPGRQL